ncbi:MAG: hypothetical protein JNJ69_08715 [Leptospiraceae bacterium]|nr:hypothetical protein [Leptospiraceae bacterium]
MTSGVFAYSFKVHHNFPEESVLYMEFQGTIQQRWAADYLKAKATGRYTGTCVILGGTSIGHGDNVECGALGINRVGGDKPDYVQDVFIDHPILPFSWNVIGINVTSYTHFINLKRNDANGDQLVTNNHNTIDGYSYNATYGFQEFGSLDSLIALGLGSSQFSINPLGCTHSACSEYIGAALGINENPTVDYMQNGSTAPLGSPNGSKQLGSDDGTNYNCSSDTAVVGSCPDIGAEVGGTFQIPNVNPGGGRDFGAFFVGNQDWVIWEPSYNAATFYYNEGWLEGFTSRNHSLQTSAIVGRYYNIPGDQILYYALTHHYTGDIVQMTHVWVSTGYNHTDIEGWAEDHYGDRAVGGSDGSKNFENYLNSQAYANSRSNHYNVPVGNIAKLIVEQTFLTYHLRFRSGYDKMTTSNTGVWQNVVTWAVQNVTAEMALVNEKAVMDLRKCRNSGACDNI